MTDQRSVIDPSEIRPGRVFSTPFESGCVVVTEIIEPEFGSFAALDSDGVLCRFVLAMVTEIRDGEPS